MRIEVIADRKVTYGNSPPIYTFYSYLMNMAKTGGQKLKVIPKEQKRAKEQSMEESSDPH